jgi:sugar phosphate isomerase/epimerase
MGRVILNPYGIAYALGLQAQGPAAPNPRPLTFEQFLALSEEIDAAGVEIFTPMVDGMDLGKLAERLRGKTVVMSQPLWTGIGRSVEVARKIGAKTIRMHLTGILCGDRAEPTCRWNETVANVKRMLKEAAPLAAEYGLSLAIEDHQDFTSAELVELCETTAPNVGVCLDTGNALSVGEDPVEFATAVAGCAKHVHLKDYRVQWTAEGYRLIRCAVGDGIIPFAQIVEVFKDRPVTLALEIGALCARHIRLLNASWWKGYPARSAEALAKGLKAARVKVMDENEEWRTPFELGAAPAEIVKYEMDQLHCSAAYLRKMNFM